MYAVEYHHFTAAGRTLLVDVDALNVIDSCELDRTLLESGGLLAPAADAGFDLLGAWFRLQLLREQRFLVDAAPQPRLDRDLRPDCRACWSRNLCDRTDKDCAQARAKAELFLAIHHY